MRAGFAALWSVAAFGAILRLQALRFRAPAHRRRQSCNRPQHVSRLGRVSAGPRLEAASGLVKTLACQATVQA